MSLSYAPSRRRTRRASRGLLAAGLIAIVLVPLGLLPGTSPARADDPVFPEVHELYEFRDDSVRGTARGLAIDKEYMAVVRRTNTVIDDTGATGDIEVIRFNDANEVIEEKHVTAPKSGMELGDQLLINMDRGMLITNVRKGKLEIKGEERDVALLIYELDGTGEWALSRAVARPEGLEFGPYYKFAPTFGDHIAWEGDTLVLGDNLSERRPEPGDEVLGNGAGSMFTVDVTTGEMKAVVPKDENGVQLFGSLYGIGSSFAMSEDYVVAATTRRRTLVDNVWMSDQLLFIWKRDNLFGSPMVVKQPWADGTDFGKIGALPAFGYRMKIDGDTLYVASPMEYNYFGDSVDDPNEGVNDNSVAYGTTTRGAVYTYSLQTGEQIAPKLLPPRHTQNFGSGFALQGNALLVSSYSYLFDDEGTPHVAEGEVHVFDTRQITAPAGPEVVANRREVEPVQLLKPKVPQREGYLGVEWGGGGVYVSGSRAAVSNFGYYGSLPNPDGGEPVWNLSSAYLFGTVAPNIVELPAEVQASPIEYGQEGAIRMLVPSASTDGKVTLTLEGVESETDFDLTNRWGAFTTPAAARDVGDYPVSMHYQSSVNGQFADATGTHTVAKAPTKITPSAPVVAAAGSTQEEDE
ncbi:hypothetical protein [Leucobacter chromiireducens]|uniref:hypothetical protein n=1 Tax=Leucobacter chromiireducens TaxID=283877 RepID=UPI000F63D0F3|nr:hypothetical protein [Leucobacter chromiireducens]